jgi:hypothetical protein
MNGLRTPALINGTEPSWANIIVAISGFPETAITAISYKDEQNIENIFGAGQLPVGRGYGNITATGSITLLTSAVEALRAASLTGRLQDIGPFTISVNYIPLTGGTLIRHKLKNVQFMDDGVDAKQGDTKIERNLTLVISHIDWK